MIEGVYVREVDDFSAAQKAEIKVGDIITEVDGKAVKSIENIEEIKNQHKIGDKLNFKIYRNKEYKNIEVTLEEQP